MSFLNLFFKLLYHQFAWTYDLVAALVSLGRWKTWVGCALPYIEGRVLEVGFGPGHLQVSMHGDGLAVFGLDESWHMARQARRRLHRQGYVVNLSRGLAQHLPFSKAAFDTVVATFPSEYFFAPDTLAEIRRVLVPGGRLVILPSVWITGSSLLERLAAGLFMVTGQTGELDAVIHSIQGRLQASGFETRHALVETPGSRVLVFIAQST